MSEKRLPPSTKHALPKVLRARLAQAAAARVARLSDEELNVILGDVADNLADELAQQLGATFRQGQRAMNKALRQARWERLGRRPSRSGTPPSLSLVLTWSQMDYVQRKAEHYGSRAAVVKAALTLLMQAEP